MADYFTHFSCLIDVGSPDKAARALALFHDLRAADQDADDPEVAAACTTALLSNEAGVGSVRERIGAEIHKRIKSACGPGADARAVAACEMSYFGALVQAGSGAFTYRQIADRLGYVAGLILGEDR